MVRIDTQEKMEARVMWYQEAIQIMRNYNMLEAVEVLEKCLKSTEKAVSCWISFMKYMQEYKKEKEDKKPLPPNQPTND